MTYLDTNGTLFHNHGMTFQKHPSTYDVIICGAGPVGLFLACELALDKCSVLILEKAENPHSPLKQLPFGIRGHHETRSTLPRAECNRSRPPEYARWRHLYCGKGVGHSHTLRSW